MATTTTDTQKQINTEKVKSVLYYVFDWFLALLGLAFSVVVLVFLVRWIIRIFTNWFPSLKKYEKNGQST